MESDSIENPQITKTYYEDDGDPLFQMQNDPDLRINDIVEFGTNNQVGRRLLQITGYRYVDITPVHWQGGRRRQGTNKRRQGTNKRRRTIRKRRRK